MSTWVRRCVVPRATHSRIRFPARSSVDIGRCGRIVLSVSMRFIRVGPAACPIQGRPVSVLSRCMWPSTSPGNRRSPAMSSSGALFDDAAAPSPTAAIFPPAMPISTSRPSASRQLVRNASTSVMGRSVATCYACRGSPRGLARATDSTGGGFMRDVISAPAPGLDLRRVYGHHQSPAIRAGGLIFCSGMVAINPETGEREHGTVTSEARRIFENLKLLLESTGSSLDRIVQVHAMIYDRIEYAVLNRLYRQYVPNAPPARTVMSVQIEAGFKVMLDVIAAAETRQPAAMIYPRQVIEPGGWRRPGQPLSPAIRAGEFVFLSGMTATDPMTGAPAFGTVAPRIGPASAALLSSLIRSCTAERQLSRFSLPVHRPATGEFLDHPLRSAGCS